MSEIEDFLPRVIIETSESSARLQVNFKLSILGSKEIPSGLNELFLTLEDWTSHCIASIQHMPYIASFGHYAVENSVQENLINYLTQESISHEVVDLNGSGEKKRYSFVLHDDDVNYVAAELSQTTHMMKAARAIQRSSLSALVAEFDYLVYRSLNAVCMDHPDFLVPDEEKVEAGFLRSGGTFEEWQSEKVQKAIEKKLRESHSDVVEWILTDIAKLKDHTVVKQNRFYKDFLEVCQRRHLFIHNGGIVNSEYIRRCEAAGISVSELYEVGKPLDVDTRYLKRSAARVYLIGAFAMFLVAQNVYPQHKNIAHKMLLSASHEFLQAGMTKMAERLIEFAEFNKKNFDQELKLKFAINKALSKLLDPTKARDEQTKNAITTLEAYDWSVTTPVFDLALACVRRDFSNLIPLARAASAAGLTYREVRSYVVFKEALGEEGFMECFPKSRLLISDSSTA